MKPAYYIILFQGPKGYRSTPAVWKQYNKMAVLQYFLLNSTLIYILFSLVKTYSVQLHLQASEASGYTNLTIVFKFIYRFPAQTLQFWNIKNDVQYF